MCSGCVLVNCVLKIVYCLPLHDVIMTVAHFDLADLIMNNIVSRSVLFADLVTELITENIALCVTIDRAKGKLLRWAKEGGEEVH